MVIVRNRTPLDTVWLEQLVQTVRPTGLSDAWAVEFLTDKRLHGFCDTTRRAARIWLPRRFFPVGQRRESPRITLLTVQEAVIYCCAHELLHCWQWEHCPPCEAPDWRPQMSERDAHAHAARCLRRYRRTGLPPPCPRARRALRLTHQHKVGGNGYTMDTCACDTTPIVQ